MWKSRYPAYRHQINVFSYKSLDDGLEMIKDNMMRKPEDDDGVAEMEPSMESIQEKRVSGRSVDAAAS